MVENKKIIPPHLVGMSTIEKIKTEEVFLNIVCTCACEVFAVYKNKIAKTEEERKGIKEYEAFHMKYMMGVGYKIGELEDGIKYAYKKNIFGKIKEKVRYYELDYTQIIKIKCDTCGKEYVIYDSRVHGEDSFATNDTVKTKNYNFSQKKLKDGKPAKIKVEILFHDSIENALPDDFDSDSFIGIAITALGSDGKKTKILDEYTS